MGLVHRAILITACVWAIGIAHASPPSNPTGLKQSQSVAAVQSDDTDLGPFAAAALAPADVRFLLRVEHAGRLRQALASRPIAESLHAFTGGAIAARSWTALANSLNMQEAQLFDMCFGRDVTLMSRHPGEWTVLSVIGRDASRQALRRLQVRVREPSFGMAVSELPEHQLLFASDGELMLIGPTQHPGLFMDVLKRWGSGERMEGAAGSSLRFSADFTERLAELDCRASRASVAAFVRHERPLGGCSMIVADVRGDDVLIRQSARFDNPLFTSPVTRLECDFSPVRGFADRALAVVMQPADVGDGPVDAYLSAGLGMGLIGPEMRMNLGDRRMLVVGEADARQMPQAHDLLTTTFVACLELKDASVGAGQLDRQMATLAARLNDLTQGALLVRLPDVGKMTATEIRHVDLGDAEQWFTGGFPVMRAVSLNWAVADHAHGKWFVVGSHPHALQETLVVLAEPVRRDPRLVGRYDNCGVINGQRLGRHVRSWRDHAQEFADVEHHERVRQTLQVIADLASGVVDCQWQMARPTATTMRLEVRATLAPARSIDQ